MIKAFPKCPPYRKTLGLDRADQSQTLADALRRLHADKDLAPTRRRDLMSSLKRIAAACDLSLSEIVADPKWLQQKLANVPPARLGRTAKTRANVLSNAVAALAHVGTDAMRRPQVELSNEWQKLWCHLGPSPKIAFGSFMRFCTFHGLAPAHVTDAVVSDFECAIIRSSLRKKPAEAIRELIMQWNRAVETVPAWPKQLLTVRSRRSLISLPLEALPKSFREDLGRYLAGLRGNNLLAETAAPPLAEATIRHRQLQIRRLFGELAADGVNLRELRDLRAIVQPKMAYRGLQRMLDRNADQSSGMIHGMAYTILTIAKHYAKLSNKELEKLRRACKRLKVVRRGMTEKNRARLREFDDPKNLDLLLLLPESLAHEAKLGNLPPLRAGRLMEVAVAIELLLMTTLRIKNLAGLHLDENISWTRSSRRGVCHLIVDRRDVKNAVDREYELSGATEILLKAFLTDYRSELAPARSRWLFSRVDGTDHVGPVVLANRISTVIRKRTGLVVNVHLFRAIGAKIYLDRNPGAYEVVRNVLGHKHLSTTTSAYTGMESVSAIKLFDRTIGNRQEEARRNGAHGRAPGKACR